MDIKDVLKLFFFLLTIDCVIEGYAFNATSPIQADKSTRSSSSSDLWLEIWMMQLPVEHMAWNIPNISEGWVFSGDGVERKNENGTDSLWKRMDQDEMLFLKCIDVYIQL